MQAGDKKRGRPTGIRTKKKVRSYDEQAQHLGSLLSVNPERPDFTKKPTQKAALRTIELMHDIYLSPNGSRAVAAADLYKVFGQPSVAHHAYLSAHLRVLKQGMVSKKSKIATIWTVHKRHLDRLKAQLSEAGLACETLPQAAERLKRSVATPMRRSEMRFMGEDQARRYEPWVGMKREVRAELFIATHGQAFDYDIECAAATLTLQAVQNALAKHGRSITLPRWEAYVADRKSARKAFAELFDVSEDQAKAFYQAVMNGSLAKPKSEVENVLGSALCKSISNEAVFTDLHAEFVRLAEAARSVASDLGFTAVDLALPNTKLLAALYRRLEDEVMSTIDEVLHKAGVHAWFIHDGFVTTQTLASDLIAELKNEVLFRTGLVIRLDCDELSLIPENL